MNTIDDLSLEDREKQAIIEASRILRKNFPVKKVVLFGPKARTGGTPSLFTDFGDGLARPAVVETDSPLHKGYKSIMVFARMKRRDLPDEAFTLNFLSRVESLR